MAPSARLGAPGEVDEGSPINVSLSDPFDPSTADGEEAARPIESLVQQEADRRLAIWLRVRVGGERMTRVAAQYGYCDLSGADCIIKRLEEEACPRNRSPCMPGKLSGSGSGSTFALQTRCS